jgi:hypothetical protein
MNLDTPSYDEKNGNTASSFKLIALGVLFMLVLNSAFSTLDIFLSRVIMMYEINPLIQFFLPQLVIIGLFLLIVTRIIATWKNSIYLSDTGVQMKINILAILYGLLFVVNFVFGYFSTYLFIQFGNGGSAYYSYWSDTMVDEVIDHGLYLGRNIFLIVLLNRAR